MIEDIISGVTGNVKAHVDSLFSMLSDEVCCQFDDKIKLLKNDFNAKVDALSDEMLNLRGEERARVNENIHQENLALNEENKSLRDKVINLSLIVSELNVKVKESENEILSLVTALKLIAIDKSNLSEQNTHGTWKTQRGNANKDQPLISHAQGVQIATSNSFSALGHMNGNTANVYNNRVEIVDDSGSDDLSFVTSTQNQTKTKSKSTQVDKRPPKNKQKQHDNTVNTSVNQQSSNKGRKNLVFIAGDSIVQNVHGWDLASADRSVAVKSFSGSRIDDMKDYLKPLLRREPQQIILHVGTNDIKSDKSPDLLVQGIVDLVTEVRNISPQTKVAISALTIRKDSRLIQEKVNETNRLLLVSCKASNVDFIRHDNIDLDCLNRGAYT